MDIEIFLDGAALLIALVVIVASFVSKTVVYGRKHGSRPQKITWFGRIFLFLAGSVGVFQFGLTILKKQHVAVNPSLSDIGLPLSEVVLSLLFLSMAVPFLIVSIRDSWLRQENGTRTQRIISICLTLIFLYLVWEMAPAITRKALTLFRHLSGGRVG